MRFNCGSSEVSPVVFGNYPLSKFFDSFSPDIDISEDKDNYYLKADLPGLKKEDVSVNLEDNVLTIRGERKAESEQKEKSFYRIERSYGTFERAFTLNEVKADQIKARYENGVLEVTVPKAEKAKPQSINIDVS